MLERRNVQVDPDDLQSSILTHNLRQTASHQRTEAAEHDGDGPVG
jgi:hypothetical protein